MLRDEFAALFSRLCMDFGVPMTATRTEQCAAWYATFGHLPASVLEEAFARVADNLQRFPKKADVHEAIAAVQRSRQGQEFEPCDLCDRTGMPERPSGLIRLWPTERGFMSVGHAVSEGIETNPTKVVVMRCPRCQNGARYSRLPVLREQDCAPGAIDAMIAYNRSGYVDPERASLCLEIIADMVMQRYSGKQIWAVVEQVLKGKHPVYPSEPPAGLAGRGRGMRIAQGGKRRR